MFEYKDSAHMSCARGCLALQASAVLLLCLPSLLWSQATAGRATVHVTDSQGAPLPDTVVVLKSGGKVLSTTQTDQNGEATVAATVGKYVLTVAYGKQSTYTQEIDLTTEPQELQISLLPQAVETVEVQAAPEEVAADVSSPTTVLPVTQVRELPSRPKTALDALPLVPGVVRTYDGQLQIAGQGEAHSALLIDGVDGSSPSSGRFTLSPPIDAVQSIHVETPSFLAQDGRFSAGAVKVETKGGGARWHFDLNDPFPEFRIRSGHVRGVRSMSPRIAVGGPILRDRVQFLESFEFIENKIPVRTLYFPNNETKVRSYNSFSRLDTKLSSSQSLVLTMQVQPQSVQYAGLDFFHPQSVTSNSDASAYIGTAMHRLVYGKGFLQSTFSVGRFNQSTGPQGLADMVVQPTGYSGNFYKSAAESSSRMEWNEALTFILPAHPQHQFTLGTSVAAVHASGSVIERPLLVEDAGGTLLQRIEFAGGSPFNVRDVQPAAYAQDHWSARKNLSVDYGLRLEGQTITGTWRAAPRVSFAWNDGKLTHGTTVRGGLGVFYDSVPLDTFSFTSLPSQHITTYGAASISDQQYKNFLSPSVHEDQELVSRETRGGDFSPMTLTESLEIEHQWGAKLSTRARLLHSGSSTVLTVTPSQSASSFVLADGGNLDYTQVELTAKVEMQKGFPLYASYVRSTSTGTLNSPSEVLSQSGGPFVRSVMAGRQPSDLPNRFILWGSVRLPWQVTLTPQFEARSGFVYQSLDVYQNFVNRGAQRQGRLPTYDSLDLRASKLVKLNTKYSLRPAISVTNATNHFNGLEVHNNVADPQFGTPFGNNDRHARFDLDVVF